MSFQTALLSELEKLAAVPKGLHNIGEPYAMFRSFSQNAGRAAAAQKAGGGGATKDRFRHVQVSKDLGKSYRGSAHEALAKSHQVTSVTNPTFELDRRISNRQPGSFQIRTPRAAVARKFSQFKKLAAKRTDGTFPMGSHIKRQMDLAAASLSNSKNPNHQMFPGGRPKKQKQLNLPFPAKKMDPELKYMRHRNRMS